MTGLGIFVCVLSFVAGFFVGAIVSVVACVKYGIRLAREKAERIEQLQQTAAQPRPPYDA